MYYLFIYVVIVENFETRQKKRIGNLKIRLSRFNAVACMRAWTHSRAGLMFTRTEVYGKYYILLSSSFLLWYSRQP